MKYMIRGGFLILLLAALSGCGSAFHNGTEMAVSSVTITGLPTGIYAGREMVFSYNTGGGWIHDKPAEFTSGKFAGTVTATGDWTLTFNPPLQVVTATVDFLLIDSGKNWDTYKIDKKHSGKSGGDVVLDNTWAGAANPAAFKGVVNGDNVEWTVE